MCEGMNSVTEQKLAIKITDMRLGWQNILFANDVKCQETRMSDTCKHIKFLKLLKVQSSLHVNSTAACVTVNLYDTGTTVNAINCHHTPWLMPSVNPR